eukprot:6265-Rhodomonas_salina.1
MDDEVRARSSSPPQLPCALCAHRILIPRIDRHTISPSLMGARGFGHVGRCGCTRGGMRRLASSQSFSPRCTANAGSVPSYALPTTCAV